MKHNVAAACVWSRCIEISIPLYLLVSPGICTYHLIPREDYEGDYDYHEENNENLYGDSTQQKNGAKSVMITTVITEQMGLLFLSSVRRRFSSRKQK